MKKIILFSVAIFILAITKGHSQTTIKGKVVDSQSKKGIPYAKISIQEDGGIFFTSYTDTLGNFNFPLVINEDSKYCCMTIEHLDYHMHSLPELSLESDYEYDFEEIELDAYDCKDCFYIEDVAAEEYLDLYLISFPSLLFLSQRNTDDLFRRYISMDYMSFEYKAKLFNKTQFGFKATGLRLDWVSFDTPQSGDFLKERYFGASFGLGTFLRYIINTVNTNGTRATFIDMGAIYHAPYYFSISQFDENNTRISRNGIHNYTDFDVFIRAGYRYGGLQANYRVMDFIDEEFVPIPRFRLGIFFVLPLN